MGTECTGCAAILAIKQRISRARTCRLAIRNGRFPYPSTRWFLLDAPQARFAGSSRIRSRPVDDPSKGFSITSQMTILLAGVGTPAKAGHYRLFPGQKL